MTIEEAEAMVMAAELGMFHGTRSELAMAYVAVAANQQTDEKKPDGEGKS